MSIKKDYEGKTFCPIPFIGIYYRGDDNQIQSCCWQNKVEHSITDYDNDIQKYWAGPEMQKMRRQFADGEWPESCYGCKWQEDNGKSSPRLEWKWAWNLLSRAKMAVEPGMPYLDLECGTHFGKPLYFDYRPDNICNLGCAMCSPNASSVLEDMVKEYPELNKHQVLENTISYPNDFLSEDNTILTSLGPHTRRIKLNGGEPTISERIKSIYKLCIENGWAKNIELQFTTNFTNVNKTWTEYLPEFKHVSIAASLDGAGDTYDYTRRPAKWKAVTSNVYKIIDDNQLKSWVFSVNLVWSVTTCFTISEWLPEMADFYLTVIEKSKANPSRFKGISFTVNQCYAPLWVSLHVLPPEFKDYVREQIKIALDHPRVKELRDVCSNTSKYQNIMPAFDKFEVGLAAFEYKKRSLRLWQDHIEIYDRARGSDITQLHPKYKELLEYDRS